MPCLSGGIGLRDGGQHVISKAADYALARGRFARDSRFVISAWDIVQSVLSVYLLLVGGALLRWTGLMRKEHDEGVMRVVYSVMMPCFMLDKILGSTVLKSGGVVLSAMGVGFALLLVGIAIGFVVGRCIGLERGTGMRTFALASGCQNFGFTAVPVVEILWSTGALALLFVHNIGVELAMWSVGVMIMSGERGIRWRKLVNGPVLAVIVGLLLVALGWDSHCVGPARKAMTMIGVGAFPLAILITGCTIMDLVVAEKPAFKIILGSSMVRLVLAPIAFLTAAKYLPIATELRQILVVQAAMPAAITPIMLARMYGGRPAIAVQIVVFTTAISLISLPWIITLGCQWIGLKPLLP